MNRNTLIGGIVLAVTLAPALLAQQPAPSPENNEPNREALIAKFKEQMDGVKLIGQFTVVGRDDRSPAKEEYTIRKVEKLPDGDKWLIHARIKYGDHDVTVPLPLDVKFAGDTGVITLSNFAIPGLGTFDSRVVIDDGKYAGTWRHGNAHGHLFGVIEKLAKDDQPAPGKTGK